MSSYVTSPITNKSTIQEKNIHKENKLHNYETLGINPS